jgi:hypothetical protein
MRIVHKKIPKILAFSHILFAPLRREFVSGPSDRHLGQGLKLAGNYRKPADLRHYLHKQVHHRLPGPVDPTAMLKG